MPPPLRVLFKQKLRAWRGFKPVPCTNEELELMQPDQSKKGSRDAVSKDNALTKGNAVGSMQRPKIFRG